MKTGKNPRNEEIGTTGRVSVTSGALGFFYTIPCSAGAAGGRGMSGGSPADHRLDQNHPVQINYKKTPNQTKNQTGLKNFLSLSGILETTGHASAFVLTQRADGANPSSAFHSKMQQHSQALTKEAITKASQSLDLNQLVQIFSCSLWLDSRLLLPDYFSLEKKREKRKA